MAANLPAINEQLSARSRLRAVLPVALQSGWAELSLLALAGVTAATLTALVHLRIRVPGHAIVLSVLPTTFGLAAAPRRRAGVVIGFFAVLTALALKPAEILALARGGGGGSLGALTSLACTGIFLDLAASRASCGIRLYLRFAAAELASNLLAFAVKGSQKYAGLDAGSRPFGEWISVAPLSYAVCGILAGLMSAWLFFRFSNACPRHPNQDGQS